MVLASHAYRLHECESILFLKTQKAMFEVVRIAEPGKKTGSWRWNFQKWSKSAKSSLDWNQKYGPQCGKVRLALNTADKYPSVDTGDFPYMCRRYDLPCHKLIVGKTQSSQGKRINTWHSSQPALGQGCDMISQPPNLPSLWGANSRGHSLMQPWPSHCNVSINASDIEPMVHFRKK